MKAKMHISTGQYSFLEVELEGTKEEIINQYFEIGKHYQDQEIEEVQSKQLHNKDW